MLPRLLTRSSAARSYLRCATRLNLPLRRWCVSRVDRRLAQALQTEIEHEAENDDKKPGPKLPNFEVVTDGMNVQLKRQLGNESITVRFLIQVTTHEEGSDSDAERTDSSPVAAIASNFAGLKNMFASSPESPGQETAHDAIADCYFSVVIEKATGALLFDCSWESSRLRIKHVAYFDDAKAAHRVSLTGDDAENTGYEGPEVDDLSENLSALWYEYLLSRDVNERMGEFMGTYSKYQEQQEYVKWLGQTKKFIGE